MNFECLYSSTAEARNGTPVPLFTDGRSLFSMYNPERDVETFLAANKSAFTDAGCILCGGIGNALHLKRLRQAFPEKLIIALELNEATLAFSKAHSASSLPEDVIICQLSTLSEILKAHYLPALYGNFAFAALRSWADHLGDEAQSVRETITATIGKISADYAVQAQFGKLWHRNILCNLETCSRLPASAFWSIKDRPDPSLRKAAVIGAGPSLNESLSELRDHRAEYCIFATDTSYGTLVSAGIQPDFTVTVDAQHISSRHFLGHSLKGTVLLADLSVNSSLVKYACDQGARLFFFHGLHPLSCLFDSWYAENNACMASPFPVVDSGAGTVLHAAVDFARKLGFTDPVFFGADFSYHDGVPYASGTYLDAQFNTASTRTDPSEKAFCTLMYRTPVIQISDTVITTDVLSRYRSALEEYLQKPCEQFPSEYIPVQKNIDYEAFLQWYITLLREKSEKALFSVLPLAAWYKKNFPDADTKNVYMFAEQQTASSGRILCQHQRKSTDSPQPF